MNDITNSGHYNSGAYNSGDRNSGHYNSGHYNSGHYNSGNYNSGTYNSGNYNSGTYNSGNCNSGNCNSGDYNSGDYNSGNYNSGYFCVDASSPTFFDSTWGGTWEEASELVPYLELPVCCEWVPSSHMTDNEKVAHPNHTTIGGYLKSQTMPLNEAFPIAWEKADDETRQSFIDLPNFNAEKFFQITGVDVRDHDTANGNDASCDEITLNGKRFRLVPIDD